MGNKQAKALYETIDKSLPAERPARVELNTITLSEKQIVNSMKEKLLSKIFKASDIQTHENDMHMNIPPDLFSDEREIKSKKFQEDLHRSILVAGHERHPQADATIQALEEAPTQKLDSAINYTNESFKTFMCYIILLRSALNEQKQAPPFENRLAQCLQIEDASVQNVESSCTSAALSFTSLLLDPKQVAAEPQVLNQALQLFRDIPALSLYGWTRQALIIDKSIDKIKSCLLYLIENEHKDLQQNAILALCHIGLACGSLEDMLLAFHYAASKKISFPPNSINEVIERTLALPEDMNNLFEEISLFDPSEMLEIVPFEQLYMETIKYEKANSLYLSCCTDGEFVYLHSTEHGLLTIGAGKNKIKGRPYTITPMADKSPLKLICINHKIYAISRQTLFKLSMKDGKLKETKKNELIPKEIPFHATSTLNYLVIYTAKESGFNKDKDSLQGVVTYYDVKSKKLAKKYEIEHNVPDLKEIVACGNIIFLIGSKRYNVIDLSNLKKLSEEDSEVLTTSCVCADPITAEMFMVLLRDPKEGLEFSKLKPICTMQGEELHSEDSVKKLKETIEQDKLAKELKLKKEVASLLGFYVPDSANEKRKYSGSDEANEETGQLKMLLGVLASRVINAEKALKAADFDKSENVFKAFKSPLGIHLSVKSIGTQIELIELYLQQAKKAGKDEDISTIISNLISMIKMLNSHILVLQNCELTLRECAGSVIAQKCLNCLQISVKSIVSEKLFEKSKIEPALIKDLTTCSEILLRSSSSLLFDDPNKVLPMMQDIAEKITADKIDPELRDKVIHSSIWLNVKKNQSLITKKIYEKEKKSLDLIRNYFAIEEKYVECRLEEILTKHSPNLNFLKFAKEEFSAGIRGIIEASFVALLLSIVKKVKKGYENFKSVYAAAQAEAVAQGKIGSEFFDYWWQIDAIIKNELLLFSQIPLITNSVFGLTLLPEQILQLSNIMMNPIQELKEFTREIKAEKLKLALNGKEIITPFEHMVVFFEVNESSITKGNAIETEYKFPFANEIHVTTVSEADLPPPASTNVLTVTDVKSGTVVATISRDCPVFNQCVKCNHIRLYSKIKNENPKELVYNGCKLKIKPKCKFGQKTLKDLLHSLMWTTCYISKAAITFFDTKAYNNPRTQSDLMNAIIGSRLLSTGIPLTSFKEIFSAQFNKHFENIMKEANIEKEVNSIFGPVNQDDLSKTLEEVYNGTHSRFDTILKQIQEYAKTHNPMTRDGGINDTIRMIFCLLLKVNDAGQEFLQSMDTTLTPPKAKEKVVSLFTTANRMRLWYTEKKRNFGNSTTEEEFDQQCKDLIQKVQGTIKLLMKFKYSGSSAQESGQMRKAIKLIRNVSEGEAPTLSETEQVKTRLSRWKNVQAAIKKEGWSDLSFTAAVIELLQGDLTCEQLVAELERCYLKGMTVYSVMQTCNKIFKSVPSRTIRIDTIAWITKILNRTDAASWEYSDSSLACGLTYQYLLREHFFVFIKELLKCLLVTDSSQELVCFLEALKWNYSSADHKLIREYELLQKINASEPINELSKLWGKELDCNDRLPEMLIETFEFIAVKIALKGVSYISDGKIDDVSPVSAGSAAGSTRSTPSTDESVTATLTHEIIRIIIFELRKAAASYEGNAGMDPSIANKYADVSRASNKEQEGKSSDKKKIRTLYLESSKFTYSPDFCIRLLRLLYHFCVAANSESSSKGHIKQALSHTDFTVLMKLMDFGSSHQQFLVLQMIPYLVTLAYQNLEDAAEKYLGPNSPRYSKSMILDVLFSIAMSRREGVWKKDCVTRNLGYALSKIVIRVLQGLLNSKNELGDTLKHLIRTILFGKPEEIKALPAGNKNKKFLELLLSVAGGEFESIHKGAMGLTKEKKEFTVVAFGSSRIDPTKEVVCEWEFNHKVHDQVIVHLLNEEGETHQMPVYELVPSQSIPSYADILKDIKPEEIAKLIKQLLKRSKAATNDTLAETLKVKLLKVLLLMMKSDKEMSKAVYSEELVVLLLGMALQYPKTDNSKSLLMAELAAEEMRKGSSQSEYKTLRHDEGTKNCIMRKGAKLLFTARSVRISARIYSHVNLDKLKSETRYEYVKFKAEMTPKEYERKIVLIEKDDIPKISLETLGKNCIAIILSTALTPLLADIKNPEDITLIEIAEKDMKNANETSHLVEEIGVKMNTQSPEVIMAEYLNIKLSKEVKANTLKGILQELVTTVVEKKEANKYKSKKEIFDILLSPSDKRESIIKEGQDGSITDERASYNKEYAMLFKQVHEMAEAANPETYADLLHDLNVFYSRHLLLRLLLRNEEKVVTLPVDLYKKLLTFLLISAAEADMMKYALQYKSLSKRLNKLLLATLKRPDTVDVYFRWTHERVIDTVYKGKVLSYSICSTPQSKLEEGIYLPFICRYMRAILRYQHLALMTNRNIDLFMDDMVGVVIIADKVTEKNRAIGLVRKIIGSAAKMVSELPCSSLERILGSDSLKALAQYFNRTERKGSVVWKMINEILLKANVLYRNATALFGEGVQTYYTKNAFNLFIASEVMKEYPKLTLVTTYLWGKQVKKEVKGKESLKLATPSPLYDTQYCVLVADPQAATLQVHSKKVSHRIALVSVDKDGCAELPAIDSEENKFTVEGNRFYLHFPCDTYAIYAFGNNDNGQLGLKELKQTEEPKVIPELANTQAKALASSGKHTHVINLKDTMYCAGKGEGRLGADSNVFLQYKNHGGSGYIAANTSATIFYDQKANLLYAIGKNPDKMFSVGATPLTNEEQIKPQESIVTQISVSAYHSLILYNERQVYGCPAGRKELFSNFIEGANTGYCMIKFTEEIDKVYKVLALNVGTIILCLSRISGHKELYSFGLPGSPVLGQSEHQLAEEYGRLEYPEYIEFVDLTGNEQMAAAITADGDLYTWGTGPLGIFSEEGVPVEFAEKPTKVVALESFKVLEVSVGTNHVLVLVADRANTNRRRVFSYGDNAKGQLGTKDVNLGFNELDFFANKKPYKVIAGTETSFVCCGEEVKGVVHKNVTCCVNAVSPIQDVIYFRKDTTNGFRTWCRECIAELPSIVLATRNPIEKISEKKWTDLDQIKLIEKDEPITCTNCRTQIKGMPVYRSAVTEVNSTICETCFFRTPTNFQPAVYYRLNSPTLNGELPMYSLSQLYETATDSLILSVSAGYKFEYPKSVTAAIKPTLSEFLAEYHDFDIQHDLDIVDLLNDYLNDKDVKIESLSLKNDLPLNYSKKVNLRKFSEDKLKTRAKIIIKLNKIVKKVIDYIDFGTKREAEDDLYSYYNRIKELIMLKTKDQIMKQIIFDGPRGKGKADCILERAKAFGLKALGQVDNNGTRSLFGQLWQQLKTRVYIFKKRPTRIKFPFGVKFKGEGGIDAGGLFRETLDQVCDELQSSNLPLLVPTPNNKTTFGEYREKWTVNPSSKQEVNFEMYEFLGALIGMSLRLGHLLSLNLSSMFWKRLTGDRIDKSDLLANDKYCVQCLDDIINIEKKGVDAKTFSSVIDDCFVTRLSDGSEVELLKNGKNIRVTFENRTEYARLVEKARLEEGAAQIKAIATGVFKIVPQAVIRLYTWRELEFKVCGKPTFNVDALKKITRYSGCSEKDSYVQYFWQALDEFTDEERSLYLRFVWGRSRMPAFTEKYVHTVCLKRCTNPDSSMPVSHTCSFQLDLPAYTCVDKAKEKMRYAIRFCQSIDADRDNFETWEDYHP